MAYSFQFDANAISYADHLGGNNHGSSSWWIFAGGSPAVLMGTMLQDCGFYVRSDIRSIEEFWKPTDPFCAATDHETDPDLFVLWRGGKRLDVEKRVRARVFDPSVDDRTTVVLQE